MLSWLRAVAGGLPVATASVLAASAIGCASYRIAEPRTEVLHPFAPIPAAGEGAFARVCVIRTSRFAQAVAFPTWDNGVLVGATKGPTFFCYKAEPGDHVIAINADEETRVSLRAEAGKSYYLHQKIGSPFWVTCEADWVSELVARDLVDDSTYEIVTRSPEPVPAPIPFARASSREK
ncbi:MAG: hypothetical protein KF819_22485 [Labilithrix sp.]|nr:hypothetical protein [Labilithrix sp.]